MIQAMRKLYYLINHEMRQLSRALFSICAASALIGRILFLAAGRRGSELPASGPLFAEQVQSSGQPLIYLLSMALLCVAAGVLWHKDVNVWRGFVIAGQAQVRDEVRVVTRTAALAVALLLLHVVALFSAWIDYLWFYQIPNPASPLVYTLWRAHLESSYLLWLLPANRLAMPIYPAFALFISGTIQLIVYFGAVRTKLRTRIAAILAFALAILIGTTQAMRHAGQEPGTIRPLITGALVLAASVGLIVFLSGILRRRLVT